MAITQVHDAATIGAAEYSIPGDAAGVTAQTGDGLYEVWIDFGAITAVADEFEVRIYEKIQAVGTQRVIFGPISISKPEVVVLPAVILLHGWDFTVKKTLGTDRSIAWSIRKASGTITTPYEDAATIGTTEYSMPNDSNGVASITAQGCYQAFMDFNAMAAIADEFEVKMYEKVQAAGTQRVIHGPISVISPECVVMPARILMNGWDLTLKKITGTDRSIPWSIRKIA